MPAQNSNQNRSVQQVVEQGLLSRTLTTVVQFCFFALATLLLAVVIEWIGMAFCWQAQGSSHSAAMLEQELSYLNSDFKHSALVAEPIEFARRCSANFYYYLFQKTGIEKGLKWLASPEPQQHPQLHNWIKYACHLSADYILAAITITSVFAVRLAVLVLSTPAFVLLMLVGMIDGLVQRYIRRWSGGRESAFVYHWAKKFILPLLVLPWVIYLAMPVSIHPNVIVLPFAVLLAVVVRVMTATFKKYL
jgi:integrating conjugative element membrane protein (TIGR03747 family)